MKLRELAERGVFGVKTLVDVDEEVSRRGRWGETATQALKHSSLRFIQDALYALYRPRD
jgi:hypothetical protein